MRFENRAGTSSGTLAGSSNLPARKGNPYGLGSTVYSKTSSTAGSKKSSWSSLPSRSSRLVLLVMKQELFAMPEAVIVSALRSPIGRANKGSLKDVRPDDLAALVVRAALERVPQLDPNLIEDMIVGCAFPEGEQGMNVARLITGLAGLPVSIGAVTVNRFCASSLTAVNMAAQAIMLGQGDAIVAAGVESMSRVPMGGFNPSFNPKLYENPAGIEVCGGHGKTTTEFEQAYIPMGMTAENLAKKYAISREEQDRYA